MPVPDPAFELRLAAGDADMRAAQRLRYKVFVEELAGDGPLVDHEARLERDGFDAYYDHLLLVDPARDASSGDHVVGVYRLMRGDRLGKIGRFYTEDEYDLTALKRCGRPLLELGRSCLHPDYRGGTAMFHLWSGLADYVADHGIEIMFGVASFHGTDVNALSEPLSFLRHRHLAPPELRVRATVYQDMDLVPPDRLDRRRAMLATPALIKAYLRLGGFVGDGAYVDHTFNTTDVCLVMDTARLNARRSGIYTRGRA